MTYLSDFQLIGSFLIRVIEEIGWTVFSTVLIWSFILFIFNLCVKTFKKIIG